MNTNKKTDAILKEIYERIIPDKNEIDGINKSVEQIRTKLKPQIKKYKANYFLGGSVAKNTLIRKHNYDVDIFISFPKKYESKKISDILEKILKQSKLKYSRLKGSRDYFQVKYNSVTIEVIPIISIKKSSEALNITDISPLHVSYVSKNINKKPGLAKEIRLAKAFCYSQYCYGAESYIKGFSGYSLEILVIYFKSFLNFIREASKWKTKEKIIIDSEKYYKNKNKVFDSINESKLISPLILIDPVQEDRNASAALSGETLEKFIESCRNFLKKPDKSFFFRKTMNAEEWKEHAEKTKSKFYLIRAKSTKPKQDSAGAKLKKFYEFLIFSLKKHDFSILKSEFDFDEKIFESHYYLIIKEPPKEHILPGPPVNINEKYIKAFRKKYPNAFVKNKRYYAKSTRKISNFNDFLKDMKKDISLIHI